MPSNVACILQVEGYGRIEPAIPTRMITGLCLLVPLSLPLVNAAIIVKHSITNPTQLSDSSSADAHIVDHRSGRRQSSGGIGPPVRPCKVHPIAEGDTCDAIARQNDVTIKDLEQWNKKTWAWTNCKKLMLSCSMCVSDGSAPLPPPQKGVECGPMKPGTTLPSPGTALNELNPCPLNACCSNWGFCGVFPQHCDIHKPEGGGPGSILEGFDSTCISNCGVDIKENSRAAATFQRIGYFESFGWDRQCLRLSAKDANTDGSYTHMHWAFGLIDPVTWTPMVNESHLEQWEEFKALPNMKRIISFGGWAYSTEAATYGILRAAIIQNRDTFIDKLVQFVEDEGLDGIDIDWEYPGAPDIMVNGQRIGQKDDGDRYLEFLSRLKDKLGDKSVSIAAPASYWYLKAFPIKKIAEIIDYIVYMTYDLHVNLTETTNALAMITKAGVLNNKIFVGEASYGRSFRMQDPSCRGSDCDFTGTRIESDAQPGRCTKTSGYISYAEVTELELSGDDVEVYHDGPSNTDVMLQSGDYISYMTPETKDTRRDLWKSHNFAGTIDWAVDLQSFTELDMSDFSDRPASGEGCISGSDNSLDSVDLCEYTCSLGFCPEPICTCDDSGELDALPSQSERNVSNIVAFDELNVDLVRLCRFACKYDYCPEELCFDKPEEDLATPEPLPNPRDQLQDKCFIYQDISEGRDDKTCYNRCNNTNTHAGQLPTGYTCMGKYPSGGDIPWAKGPSGVMVAPGECQCDLEIINIFADIILDALPAIAQINCYMLMSTFQFVLNAAMNVFPSGRITDAALGTNYRCGIIRQLRIQIADGLTTAAQMAAYVYDATQEPQKAFSWWLSPCGGDNLVPDEIKNVYDTLNAVADGASSFQIPKKIGKGSGKKGDDGNPIDRSKPRPGSGVNSNNGTPSTNRKCRIKPGDELSRKGPSKNTLLSKSCDQQDKTQCQEWIITSITYGPKPTAIAGRCSQTCSQAYYHYSSATRVHPGWATWTCPEAAATTRFRAKVTNIKDNTPGIATAAFQTQHSGKGWLVKGTTKCDMDEYPPAYLMDPSDDAWRYSGLDVGGQSVRHLPDKENRGAANAWRSVCFAPLLENLSDKDLTAAVEKANGKPILTTTRKRKTGSISVDYRPEFYWGTWDHASNPPVNDGLEDNPCWNKKDAPNDPGQVLLTYDPYYVTHPRPYDYTKDM